MSYRVKEIFATLQGEGAQAGRAAVFCRLAGCNLWSGREEHRPSAVCSFCDTDFLGTDGTGGGRFAHAEDLAGAVATSWPGVEVHECDGATTTPPPSSLVAGRPLVVCTGGEPLLQLDRALVGAFHGRGFEVAVETNGTLPVPDGVDWVCVSPKASADLVVETGDELKLVFPQAGAPPERFAHLAFGRFSLQPMDGPDREANTEAAIAYCLHHPRWRLSVQMHKYVGIR